MRIPFLAPILSNTTPLGVKKVRIKPLLLILLMLLTPLSLGACTGIYKVDTLEKRILVIEVGYEKVIDTLTKYVEEDRFSDEELEDILPELITVSRARDAYKFAKEMKDTVSMQSELAIINSLLPILQGYLTEAEKRGAI